jgi:hypothetical protein
VLFGETIVSFSAFEPGVVKLGVDLIFIVEEASFGTDFSQVHLIACCMPWVKADCEGISNAHFRTNSERGTSKGVRALGFNIYPLSRHVPSTRLPLDLFLDPDNCPNNEQLLRILLSPPFSEDEKTLQHHS